MTGHPICMLIDDDPDDREIFGIALHSVYDQATYISDPGGINALDRFQKDGSLVPDFIFIDLNMAMMGGKECFKELKKIPRLSQTRFIFYSTSSFEKDLEETKSLGSDHFITKPSRINDLVKILQHLFFDNSKSYYLNDVLKN